MQVNNTKNYWLYVLKLEQGKYYVGVTSHDNPYMRIRQHGKFASAAWTDKYKPLKDPLVELKKVGNMTYSEAKKIESNLMMEYVDKYGQNNVRGGNVNFTEDSVRIGNRFWKRDDFETMIVIPALLLIIVALGVAYQLK